MPCDAVSEWYRVDQIKDLLYKRVSVIVGEESATAKNCVSGILIAADPISHSCVLLTGEVNKDDPIKSELYVVPEVDWASITILPDQPSSCELEPLKTALTAVTKSDSSQPLTPELTEKLDRLQTFIRGYNLTAEIQGSSLRVQNCVTILAPFSSADCRATNEIVLDRVANLVTQFNAQE